MLLRACNADSFRIGFVNLFCSNIPRNVLETLHIVPLPPHSSDEKQDKVKQKHGPEDRDVKNLEKGGTEGEKRCVGGGVPKLELRKASDKGTELVVVGSGKDRA